MWPLLAVLLPTVGAAEPRGHTLKRPALQVRLLRPSLCWSHYTQQPHPHTHWGEAIQVSTSEYSLSLSPPTTCDQYTHTHTHTPYATFSFVFAVFLNNTFSKHHRPRQSMKQFLKAQVGKGTGYAHTVTEHTPTHTPASARESVHQF